MIKTLAGQLLLRGRQFLFPRKNVPVKKLTGKAYWEQRVQQYGRRSVLNIRHPDSEFDMVTRTQKREIFPHLQAALQGNEQVLLDFGCGPGRFTGELARLIGGKAIGVDIVEALLTLAPRAPDVEYLLMQEGDIPLPDQSVDVVWSCLTLGGITTDATLQRTVREIERVLHNDGLLFLVENTAEKPDAAHWHFRQLADYQALFPDVVLHHVHDYDDMGERISVMTGRKSAQASHV